MSEILSLKDLKVYYPIRSGFFKRVTDNVTAVDGVDLTIHEGETVGLVGESGSGKTTIGKTIVGLEQMTSGKLIYKGQDVSKKKISPEPNLSGHMDGQANLLPLAAV